MAGKTKTIKEKPMVIKNPSPSGEKPELSRDMKFLGNALVKEVNRINEIELSMETLRQDLNRVMTRMGL